MLRTSEFRNLAGSFRETLSLAVSNLVGSDARPMPQSRRFPARKAVGPASNDPSPSGMSAAVVIATPMTATRDDVHNLLDQAAQRLAALGADGDDARAIPLAAVVSAIVRDIETREHLDSEVWRIEAAKQLRDALGISEARKPS